MIQKEKNELFPSDAPTMETIKLLLRMARDKKGGLDVMIPPSLFIDNTNKKIIVLFNEPNCSNTGMVLQTRGFPLNDENLRYAFDIYFPYPFELQDKYIYPQFLFQREHESTLSLLYSNHSALREIEKIKGCADILIQNYVQPKN